MLLAKLKYTNKNRSNPNQTTYRNKTKNKWLLLALIISNGSLWIFSPIAAAAMSCIRMWGVTVVHQPSHTAASHHVHTNFMCNELMADISHIPHIFVYFLLLCTLQQGNFRIVDGRLFDTLAVMHLKCAGVCTLYCCLPLATRFWFCSRLHRRFA